MKIGAKLCLLIFLFASSVMPAQQPIYKIEGGGKQIDIPFRYENNFIIVDVLFNRTLPLKFIFDTGAEYTILAKREFTDILGVNYDREFKIVGADLKSILTAYLAKNIHFGLAKLNILNQHVLVLEENYLNFEELAGMTIDGIIGADIFKNFVVTFNFKRQVITLKEPINFTPPTSGYQELPIEIFHNRVYLLTNAKFDDSKEVANLKLLLDTGASLPLLLHANTDEQIKLPENIILGNIGIGLGGQLNGYLGRTKELSFSNFSFNNVVTSFQETLIHKDSSILNNRNGILGNVILDRFTFIIDYHRKKIYFKPNKNYNKDFKFDRSGIYLIAGGFNLNQYTIRSVIIGSPADLAGIKVGDEIKSINRIPASFFSLKEINRKFQKREGKRFRLKIRRNGEKMVFHIRLKDII